MESIVVRNRDERRVQRRLERLIGGLEALVEASCGVECWLYTRAVAGSTPAAPTQVNRRIGGVPGLAHIAAG